MAIKAILFDLDGTLLPMDTDDFGMQYITALSACFNRVFHITNGLELIYSGVKHSMMHDPALTNREAFFISVTKALCMDTNEIEEKIMPFYHNEYDTFKKLSKPDPLAKAAVQAALDKGFSVLIATNPLFPYLATYKRVQWAGLDDNMYKELTTYETYHFCKPYTAYYDEILKKYGLSYEDCVMVGNDADDDLCCAALGMKTFWMDDYAIIKPQTVPAYNARGSFKELIAYIKSL